MMVRVINTCLVLLLLLSASHLFAAEFNGVVKRVEDDKVSDFFQAKIEIKEGTKPVVLMAAQPDGSYKFAITKSASYTVKIWYPEYTDTTFTFTTDKNGKPSANNIVVHLKKHGIRLFGAVRTMEFIPIKDVVVILKNVMTREEKRVMTGKDGAYAFKLEYENNYRLSVDKRSDGIFNKYKDTVLYISTISINQPMDYRLDVKLEEDREKKTEGILDYDPMQPNKNTKPIVDVKNKTYEQPKSKRVEPTPPAAPEKTTALAAQVQKTPPTTKPAVRDSSVVAQPVKGTVQPGTGKNIPARVTTPTQVVTEPKPKQQPNPIQTDPYTGPNPEQNKAVKPGTIEQVRKEPATQKPAKQESEVKVILADPPPLDIYRPIAEIKADIEKLEKELEAIKKKEEQILKQDAIEKKQKEKNKGVEVVIIRDEPYISPAQIAVKRQDAEKNLKLRQEELEKAKAKK